MSNGFGSQSTRTTLPEFVGRGALARAMRLFWLVAAAAVKLVTGDEVSVIEKYIRGELTPPHGPSPFRIAVSISVRAEKDRISPRRTKKKAPPFINSTSGC